MAVMNPYNYSKPRSHIKINNEVSKDEVSKSVLTSMPPKDALYQQKSTQYLESKIMAAKPEELTYMLYEGLIKFIKKAIIAVEGNTVEDVNSNAQRAQAIIDELRATLNKDVPMSASLDQLYEYMSYKLVEANISKDIAAFNDALEIAESFKETWREAFNIKA